jgi:hypothetical protein
VRDVHQLLVPGGRFAVSVWGPPERVPNIRASLEAVSRMLNLPPPAPGTPGVFSLADAGDLADRFRAAGFDDVQTETLVARGEFDSLEQYVEYLQEISAPINNLLANESAERRADVWRAVAEANQEFVGADGRLTLSGESILVVGRG